MNCKRKNYIKPTTYCTFYVVLLRIYISYQQLFFHTQYTIIKPMDKFLSKTTKLRIKTLAYYQIFGGIVGLGLVIYWLANTTTVTGLIILFFLLATALYSYSIYCGQQLLKANLKRALSFSCINFVLQIVSFMMFGYAFKYASGLLFGIEIDLSDGFDFTFNFSFSAFQFIVNSDKELFKIGINVFAIFGIYYIEKIAKSTVESSKTFDEKENIIYES